MRVQGAWSAYHRVPGDLWKFHRTMARPFFTRDRISDFDLFSRHANLVIEKMKNSVRAGQAFNFQVRNAQDAVCF